MGELRVLEVASPGGLCVSVESPGGRKKVRGIYSIIWYTIYGILLLCCSLLESCPETDSFLQKGPKTDSFDITWYISYKFVLIRVNSYMCRRERLRSSFTLTPRGLVDPHLCRQQYMRRNPKARASSNEGVVDKLELKLSVLGQT